MSALALLWSMNASVALTLAMFCVFAWIANRLDPARLAFCLAAFATMACALVELEMMHSRTPAEIGEWIRWYHIPVFVTIIGQVLFVWSYLGTGRLWLLCTIIAARLFILIANFALHPNFNFREIASLRSMSFLGERISVIGDHVTRPGQWLAVTSLILVVVFVIDAVGRSWRIGTAEARRKALTVGLAIVPPMVFVVVQGQMVAFGIWHIPILASVWFLGTLTVVAYELSRDLVASKYARAELAELRSELAQASRVTALGHLASSLAHELGQPLTAIRTNAEAAQRHLRSARPDLEELDSILDDIVDDDERASDVVHRMRSLIKRREIEMRPLALDEVMDDVLALVRNEAGLRNIKVECIMEAALPHVLADRVHISQVLLNLVANGMDAVQGRPPDDRRVRMHARFDDARGGVEVAVSDSGTGISPENFDKLFTPLFTTKSDGLGMGLALSRTIIDAHGGQLWAEQNNGRPGTAFRFTLPPTSGSADVSRLKAVREPQLGREPRNGTRDVRRPNDRDADRYSPSTAAVASTDCAAQSEH